MIRSDKRFSCGAKAAVFCLLFAGVAACTTTDTYTVTLDPNLPADYILYSYTATDGSTQSNIPVAPYPATLSDTDGLYNNDPEYTICYDLNNATYAGKAYTGQLAYNTDTATMEATYLANQMNLAGTFNAPNALQGALSLAIWQIMFPSSNQYEGSYFPVDPAADVYIADAIVAVSSGLWTVADSNLYPTFMPNDTTAQRFGLILSTTVPVPVTVVTPEPVGGILLSSGMIVLLLRRAWRR